MVVITGYIHRIHGSFDLNTSMRRFRSVQKKEKDGRYNWLYPPHSWQFRSEHLHEAIQERAKEGKRWSLYLAISTAFMAVLAAIAGLMAGHYSNEALIEQIKASDQWSYYQAKGIKAEIASLSHTKDIAQIEKYKTEQQSIKQIAERGDAPSRPCHRRRVRGRC